MLPSVGLRADHVRSMVYVPPSLNCADADASHNYSDVVVLTPMVDDDLSTESLASERPLLELAQADESRIADEELPPDALLAEEFAASSWTWQWLPEGLIYRSYMAGVHEPRMAIVAYHEGSDRTIWDATLGGRVGLLRYGDCDPLHPQGFELDFYGAAVARLDAGTVAGSRCY